MLRILLTLLLALLGACSSSSRTFDLLITNGTIYDGNGGEPFQADIAVVNDRIVAIGALNGLAKQTIDAAGYAVAPGFINMLSWATESLAIDGRSQSDIRQGVTLEVFGEGNSEGPINETMRQDIIDSGGFGGADVSWTTLDEYLQFLILLAALFVISGGILLTGDLRATPLTNTGFLVLGGVLASFAGTTGASMSITCGASVGSTSWASAEPGCRAPLRGLGGGARQSDRAGRSFSRPGPPGGPPARGARAPAARRRRSGLRVGLKRNFENRIRRCVLLRAVAPQPLRPIRSHRMSRGLGAASGPFVALTAVEPGLLYRPRRGPGCARTPATAHETLPLRRQLCFAVDHPPDRRRRLPLEAGGKLPQVPPLHLPRAGRDLAARRGGGVPGDPGRGPEPG